MVNPLAVATRGWTADVIGIATRGWLFAGFVPGTPAVEVNGADDTGTLVVDVAADVLVVEAGGPSVFMVDTGAIEEELVAPTAAPVLRLDIGLDGLGLAAPSGVQTLIGILDGALLIINAPSAVSG